MFLFLTLNKYVLAGWVVLVVLLRDLYWESLFTFNRLNKCKVL